MYEITFILSVIILGYVLHVIYKEEHLLVIPDNDKIQDNMFKCSLLSSLLIFIYVAIYKGFKCGFFLCLFSWCFLVVLTPLPEATVLLTMPLKYIAKLPLERGHVIVSVLATILLLLFYTKGIDIVKKSNTGGIFTYIMENKLYHMFTLSIASSIMISKFLNDAINAYTQKKAIFLLNETNKYLVLLTGVSMTLYFRTIYKYNIDIH